MDDTPSPENPAKDFNRLDLSQLQGFSFGTQWTQDKSTPGGSPAARESRRNDQPRRDFGDPHRDRRGFRRPMGQVAPASAPESRPEGQPDSGPPQDRRDFRGPPREGGSRPPFGGRPGMGRESAPLRNPGPYISPTLAVAFYPEDVGFTALAKAVRASCRTYELFEIARVIIGKNDRFVAVVQRILSSETASSGAGDSGVKAAPFFFSVPDGMPFETEDAAIAHVLEKHLALFFDTAEVEIEPPKGNFQVVNRCGVTGFLLGPPNYHRYNQIVQQYHAAQVGRMSFEAFRSRIETVRDPEVVNQWLTQMKKATCYTWKIAAEGETPPAFHSLEDARQHLLTQARDKVVRSTESARFHGRLLEIMPAGEIRRAVEGALERQRKFPLDTANALRGRLRREGFTIFKKGSKGISYVCAVKRKFRVPGQTFADSIGALISYIEANPMVRAGELPQKFLKLVAAEGAPTEGDSLLSPDDQARLARLNGDLRWLVSEGYVTEFIDGRLFAPPAMVDARKREIEGSEHDLENFPEAPPAAPSAEAAPAPVDVATPAIPDEESPNPVG